MTKKFAGPDDFARYFNRQGQPIDLKEWGTLSEDRDYKVLKQTTAGIFWISTIWLGLDHSWGRPQQGHPVIFETMVFEQYKGNPEAQGLRRLMDAEYSPWLEVYSDRYETEAEALAGHAAMVEKWSRPQ